VHTRNPASPANWRVCRDEEHGFSLRHPPDWEQKGPPGRCVQLQRGEATLPEDTHEVDVFIRILALEGGFPADYLRAGEEAAEQRLGVGRGVTYSDREELSIGGLDAVRARFRSAGPTPNRGIEYAIRKGNQILDAYASRPTPEVEAAFDLVMRTLEW